MQKTELWKEVPTEQEIINVVETGEVFPAKYGRTGFRNSLIYNGVWEGKYYYVKQIECFAVKENDPMAGNQFTRKIFLVCK